MIRALAILLVALIANAHAQELVIGDSIAVGVAGAGKLPGDAKVGRAPSAIVGVIDRLAPFLRGRVVILSTGLSNAPSQTQAAAFELDLLQQAGAKVIVLGVGEDVPGLSELNPWLQDMANGRDMLFVWGWRGVHPADYGDVLRGARVVECRVWRICGV